MQIREASVKWNISERRIRQLIQDGRIEGAEKIGTTWNIPDDTNKPIDKRVKDEIEFKIDLPEDYFKEVDEKLARLNSERPLSKEATESLQNAINLEWTYNSNGIEGNTLTLKETKVVLEGITIGGKSVREHLEAINHENAIEYLEELIGAKSEIYQLIMEFAKRGKSIIINTLEIPEIMKVADRCAVLSDGRIVKVFNHSEINEKDVMLYSTNALDARS